MVHKKTIGAIFLFLLVMVSYGAVAADFDWMGDLNSRAESDPGQFRSSLSERFNIEPARVKGVLDAVGAPADAYMVMRLAEMSGRPTDFVLNRYRDDKKKGWGALAKSLGIKPGSQEFHALKQGHDLYRGKKKDKGGDEYKIFDADKGKNPGKDSPAGAGMGKNQQSGSGKGKK